MRDLETNFAWTDERIAELRKLWDANQSCSEIARALGCTTRNQVIGKVHRLGLSGRVKVPAAPKTPPKPKIVVKPAPPPRLAPIVEEAVPKQQPRPTRDGAFDPAGRSTVSLLNLASFGQCRWPFDTSPARYCGAPTERPEDPNCSYCAEHAALSYNAPAPKTLRPERIYEPKAHSRWKVRA